MINNVQKYHFFVNKDSKQELFSFFLPNFKLLAYNILKLSE
jgi:hypothetical protein